MKRNDYISSRGSIYRDLSDPVNGGIVCHVASERTEQKYLTPFARVVLISL